MEGLSSQLVNDHVNATQVPYPNPISKWAWVHTTLKLQRHVLHFHTLNIFQNLLSAFVYDL